MQIKHLQCKKATVKRVYADYIPVKYGLLSELGSGDSVGGGGVPAVTAVTNQRVAVLDTTGTELLMYEFDGTQWSLVGSGEAVSFWLTHPSMCTLTGSEVAVVDAFISELQTWTFSGSEWAKLGSSIGVTPWPHALTSLNETDIALIAVSENEFRRYTFSGSQWSQVGSIHDIPSIGDYIALTTLDEDHVAFVATGLVDELRTYKWDGGTWVLVGSGISIVRDTPVALAALNNHDVLYAAYNDANDIIVEPYYFDYVTNTWSLSGPQTVIPAGTGGGITMTALNGSDVVLISEDIDDLQAYRTHYTMNAPFHL